MLTHVGRMQKSTLNSLSDGCNINGCFWGGATARSIFLHVCSRMIRRLGNSSRNWHGLDQAL